MRRRADGEVAAPFRAQRDGEPLHRLRERLATWVRTNLDALRDAVPQMPVEDRAADTWEPLLAIADLAGGTWPARARAACIAMAREAEASDAEGSLGVRLLSDCRDVFAKIDGDAIGSDDLVRRLRAVSDAPWVAFNMTARDLARRLRPYGIRPDRIPRVSETQVRGYRREDFADALVRYLKEPAHRASPDVTASFPQASPVTEPPGVTETSVTDPVTVTAGTCANDAVTVTDAPPGSLPPWTPARTAVGFCVACGDSARTVDETGRPCHVNCRAS
jgi:hypothetical protein